MSHVLAAGVTIDGPFLILGAMLGALIALGAALAILKSANITQNLKLLREERDDYAKAKVHADEQRDEAEVKLLDTQSALKHQIEQCDAERKEFTAKLTTLESVVSGKQAVREGVDLLLAAQTIAHKELLMELAHLRTDTKDTLDSLLKAIAK